MMIDESLYVYDCQYITGVYIDSCKLKYVKNPIKPKNKDI